MTFLKALCLVTVVAVFVGACSSSGSENAETPDALAVSAEVPDANAELTLDEQRDWVEECIAMSGRRTHDTTKALVREKCVEIGRDFAEAVDAGADKSCIWFDALDAIQRSASDIAINKLPLPVEEVRESAYRMWATLDSLYERC